MRNSKLQGSKMCVTGCLGSEDFPHWVPRQALACAYTNVQIKRCPRNKKTTSIYACHYLMFKIKLRQNIIITYRHAASSPPPSPCSNPSRLKDRTTCTEVTVEGSKLNSNSQHIRNFIWKLHQRSVLDFTSARKWTVNYCKKESTRPTKSTYICP